MLTDVRSEAYEFYRACTLRAGLRVACCLATAFAVAAATAGCLMLSRMVYVKCRVDRHLS